MQIDNSIIKDKIRSYVNQTAYVDKKKIKDDTMIFRDGYYDSMGFMNLIAFIENEYGIQTGDSDMIEENFGSINAITDYINRKINS